MPSEPGCELVIHANESSFGRPVLHVKDLFAVLIAWIAPIVEYFILFNAGQYHGPGDRQGTRRERSAFGCQIGRSHWGGIGNEGALTTSEVKHGEEA